MGTVSAMLTDAMEHHRSLTPSTPQERRAAQSGWGLCPPDKCPLWLLVTALPARKETSDGLTELRASLQLPDSLT